MELQELNVVQVIVLMAGVEEISQHKSHEFQVNILSEDDNDWEGSQYEKVNCQLGLDVLIPFSTEVTISSTLTEELIQETVMIVS
jgi:hypothetical protein